MNFIRLNILIITLISFMFSNENNHFYNKAENSRINLLNSNISSTQIEIEIDDYTLREVIIDNNLFYKVNIDGGTPILETGSPDLHKLSTSIIIPDYSEMKVDIIDFEYTEVQDINIAPSKGNIFRDVDPSTIPYSFSETYNEDKFYPSNLVSLGEPYILRDVRGQGVIINPIQYNPITKTLRIYNKMIINVEEDNVNKLNRNVFSRSMVSNKTTADYKQIYSNLFINYNSDTRFNYLDDQGGMLVISFDDFIDEMEEFVIWKNKKGIPTEIVGVNEIGNSVSQIQEYVSNYYYENNLAYLLLVGDVAQIPTPIINGASSDPSYGFIDGNDSFAEVIVGRFSANNPGELQTQIDRSLNYEQNPLEVDHFDNALGIASNQGTGYGGLDDNEFNDLLWNDFLSGYTYENFEGIYDPSGSVSQGMDAINTGVGVINYTGHAGPTGWGNGAPLGVNDVHQLTNTGKLPFIFTVGCNPGEFNNYGECFCEAWMRATDDEGNPTGAIAHVGSTISQSWEPPMHGQWAMNAILTETYDDNISRSFGGITVNGCMHMNEAQGSYGINETNHWTIFGDPSIVVRTNEPEDMIVSYNNTIVVGQSELVIDVGVDGALAAISSNGELLTSGLSFGGVVVLDLTGASLTPGQVDLVITSFNSYPHQSVLDIITPDSAYLVFNDVEIVNDTDDLIEFGETIEMNLVIENVGTYNTNAITVSIFSDDEYVTVLDNNSMIAYAISGATAITENTLSFMVASNVPDLHNISFNGLLDDGDNEWEFSFSLQAHAPVFEIVNPILVDENMDGIWDPGEEATIIVDLINSGSAPFNYYPGATMTTDNPNINILSGENDNTFYAIMPNSSYEGSFLVESIESTPLNTEVSFEISWGYSPTAPCDNDYFQGDSCVEQAYLVYSSIIGHPPILVWDPSNQHISGSRLVEYFNENNITGFDYVDSQTVPSVENYTTAFIFLGVYAENYVLNESDAQGFISLLNGGGNVYMEGADTWAFDVSTTLHSMFGLEPESDGSADLSTINGVNGTFAEGLSFSYTGGNSYVDRLSPNQGYALLRNESPEYVTAVAYENESQNYKTIGASHDLGGLQGDGFNIYVNGILEFFAGGNTPPPDECSAGDINADSMLDITDIVSLVNIVLNIGGTPSENELCAADFNSDGLINVLDVIQLVNSILDS